MAKRFFRHGELPLVLLQLLEVRPAHPWDLLNQLVELLDRRHAASPGTVYPAVRALADAGLVVSQEEGRRSVFSLTEAGRALLRDHRPALNDFEARTGVSLPPRQALDTGLDDFVAEVRRWSPTVGAQTVQRVLSAALEELRKLAKESRKGVDRYA